MSTKYIPDVFIVGSIQHKKNFSENEALEMAYHNSAYILDDENIKLVVSIDNDTVHYIAAKAKDFVDAISSSEPPIYNPLSAALPGKLIGMSKTIHRGDGLYVFPASISPLYHCIAVANGKLSSYTAKIEEITEDYPGLPVFNYANKDENIMAEWITPKSWSEKNIYAFTKKTIKTGIYITVVSIIIFFASILMEYSNNYENKQREKIEQILNSLNNTVTLLQKNNINPMLLYIETLQKLTAVTEKNYGVIEEYKVDNGKIIWTMRLPAWVVASEFKHLGDNISVDYDNIKKEIILKSE